MMHHGFSSKEARRARKLRYRFRKTSSHTTLLVARQGDVSRKLNQAFLLVDSLNFNFVDKERTDIHRFSKNLINLFQDNELEITAITGKTSIKQ